MAVKLVVRRGGGAAGAVELSYEFEQARIAIGRGPGADVRLPSATVSGTHALLEQRGGYCTVRDERSLNGTFVNGSALVPNRARALADGDEIEVGEFVLSFQQTTLVQATTPERTASLARRMLRDLLGAEHAASAMPHLEVSEGPDRGTRIQIDAPPSRLVIGRAASCALVLSDVDVSREHIEVQHDLDGCLARDLGSKNGMEVNGKLLRARRLRHGDVLRIGKSAIVYGDPSEDALRALDRAPERTLTRTQPSLPAEPSSERAERVPEPEPVPEESTRESDEPTSSPVDYLVFLLAALILAASAAGLVWLLD
jgi:pSer/pThr/pTyr-binding forkhead associated (FHA) protein